MNTAENFKEMAQRHSELVDLFEALMETLPKKTEELIMEAARWYLYFNEKCIQYITDPSDTKQWSREEEATIEWTLSRCFKTIACKSLPEKDEARLLEEAERKGILLKENAKITALLKTAYKTIPEEDKEALQEMVKAPTPSDEIDRQRLEIIKLLGKSELTF